MLIFQRKETLMKQRMFLVGAMAALVLISGHRDDSMGAAGAQISPDMSFFVSSAKSKTANLGGLRGADRICQMLASAVGLAATRPGAPT
jgi:hypothetical protein